MGFIEIVSGNNIKNARSACNLWTVDKVPEPETKTKVHILPIISKKHILENFEIHKNLLMHNLKPLFT
jgi:hypothetical protein